MKKTIVESLNKKKVPHTLDILNRQYGAYDVICLQEVSAAFVNSCLESTLASTFHIVPPAVLDAKRDQNSVILLRKATFPSGSLGEITSDVSASFPPGEKVPVANGDILAIVTKDVSGKDYVIASFHGDTNGLATIPVVTAMVKALSSGSLANHRLIFGLDANTYEKGDDTKQDVMEFGKAYVKLGLTSNFGDEPDRENYTTYNARTFLQPQLNKACKSAEKRECGDVNPKDFILFKKKDFTVVSTGKDNTGTGNYIENVPFPTLEWPSDHGLLSATLESQ